MSRLYRRYQHHQPVRRAPHRPPAPYGLPCLRCKRQLRAGADDRRGRDHLQPQRRALLLRCAVRSEEVAEAVCLLTNGGKDRVLIQHFVTPSGKHDPLRCLRCELQPELNRDLLGTPGWAPAPNGKVMPD